MMLYEARVSEELQRVLAYALGVREKWLAGTPSADLLRDRDSLEVLCDRVLAMLPESLARASHVQRHLAWMQRNLALDKPAASESDINDICDRDLPVLADDFKQWCVQAGHYDEELREKVVELLGTRQYDSAIRRAFVILKTRMVVVFEVTDNIDGADLVNQLFGTKSEATPFLSAAERQAFRDLLSGMYGVFRNKYMHEDVDAPFYETDAILSMVNFALKRLDTYRARRASLR